MSDAKTEYFTGKVLEYDDIEIGMETPPYVFELTEKIAKGYAEAVEDDNPFYRDESAAKEAGFDGIIAPPPTVGIYSKISNFLGAYTPKLRPPPGSVHARQTYEFFRPVNAGEKITSYAKFIDKYIKKERKYLVIETIHKNEEGEIVVRGECVGIWSK